MPLYDITSDCGLSIPDKYLRRCPDAIIHFHVGEDGTLHRCTAHLGVGSRCGSAALPVHPSETVVVWEHPVHGIRYPGRSDAPMPPQYRRWGFERREIRTLPDMNRFERVNHVRNEKMHFDSNGRADRED